MRGAPVVVLLGSPAETRDAQAVPQEAAILGALTGSSGSYPKALPRLQHDGQFHTPGHPYTGTVVRTHASWLASHARINTWEPERP